MAYKYAATYDKDIKLYILYFVTPSYNDLTHLIIF